jgi:hypothetical protein
VFPDLITHVSTTDATVTSNQMTGSIDDELAAKILARLELSLPHDPGLTTRIEIVVKTLELTVPDRVRIVHATTVPCASITTLSST